MKTYNEFIAESKWTRKEFLANYSESLGKYKNTLSKFGYKPEDVAGSFDWITPRGQSIALIFKHKDQFRMITHTTDATNQMPIVKIDKASRVVYFSSDKEGEFESKGVKLKDLVIL